MLTPQQIIMIVFGVVACFAGYSMFRSMLPLWGFLLGGWIAYNFFPVLIPEAQSGSLAMQALIFVGGGLIGGVVARPLYFVTIFLTGAVLGGVIGVFVGAIVTLGGVGSMRQVQALVDMAFPPVPQTAVQFILMIVFGLMAGGLAIMFQRNMLIASTAFLGGAVLVTGLAPVIGGFTATTVGRSAVMVVGWLAIGLLGMFIQAQLIGD